MCVYAEIQTERERVEEEYLIFFLHDLNQTVFVLSVTPLPSSSHRSQLTLVLLSH